MRVRYLKFPDQLHWHFDVRPLGDDEHGLWYCLPAGARVQRGAEPPRHQPSRSVLLIRPDAWWSAFWHTNAGDSHPLYIDVVTPPVWSSDGVRMHDLDLDVVRTWEGAVELLDEDEFLDHRRRFDYPEELVEGAETAARSLLRAVEACAEPFGRASASWLALSEQHFP